MGRGSKDGVKVVIINTQYVETDAGSFKSVVQSLTGKESTAAEAQEKVSGYQSGPVLDRGTSFKDFDTMLRELPPLDELYRLYTD